MRRLVLLGLLLSLALPASALGHATMTNDAGRISWRSTDAASNSTLEVTISGGKIRFYDPTEDGGMSPTRGCDPGQADQQGYIREVTCSPSGITELFVDLGGGDDQARIDVPMPVTVNGRDGNDRITTGGPDDTLFGGPGNDVLEPGAGADVVQAEAGDDELKIRDGIADQVVCADGNDRVESDDKDQVGADASCESVNGAAVPAPGGGGGGGSTDAVAPRVEVPGARSMRARRGRFALRVGVDERASLVLSAVLRTRGRSYRLRAVRVGAGGPGVRRVTLRLSSRARAALARARRASARISVTARDEAGNAGRLSVTLRLRA